MPLWRIKIGRRPEFNFKFMFVLIAFVIIPRLSHLSTIGNFYSALLLCAICKLFNKIAL